MNNIFGLFFVEPKDRKSLISRSVKKYSEDLKKKEMEFLNVFLTTVLDHSIESIDRASDNKLHETSTSYYINRVCYYAEDIFRLFYELDLSEAGYNQFFRTSDVHELPGKLLVNYLECELEILNSVSWYKMIDKDPTTQRLVLLANSDSGRNIKYSISRLRDAVTKEEVSDLEKILFGYNTNDSFIFDKIDEIEKEPPVRNLSYNERLLDMRDTYMPGLNDEMQVPDGKLSVEFHMHKSRDHKELLGKLVKGYLSDSQWFEFWKSAANSPNLRAEASISCNFSVGEEIAEEIREDLEKLGDLLYELTAHVHISYPPARAEGILALDDHGGFYTVLMDKGGKVSIENTTIN